MWSLLFILIGLAVSSTNSFTVDQYVGLSTSLKSRFHAVSWFLVNNGTLASQREVALLHKALASTLGRIKVTHITIDLVGQTSKNCQCSENRPMFVLFEGEATKIHLKLQHKIPSYPRWLLFLDSTSSLDEYFDEVYVPFDCEFLVAVQFGSEISITEIYRVAYGYRLNARHFGTWDQDGGMVAPETALYERRRDLEGLTLKAVCMENLPELEVSKANDQTEKHLDGLYGMIWMTLQKQLNFTFFLVELAPGDFGSLKNGSWTGMLSRVLNKDVDVGLNGFTYDSDRMTAVTFLRPVLLSRAILYVLKPTARLSRWDAVLTPFTGNLWFGVVSGVVLSGVWLAASLYIGRRHGVEEGVHEQLDLASALFHVFAIYCAQSSSCAPRAASSRAVLLLAGLCAAVVCAAYASALTSSLAVEQPALAHQTISEYVDDPEYDLEMSASTFLSYVNRPRNNLLRSLYKKMSHKVDSLPISRQLGITKLCGSTSPYGWFSTKNLPYEILRALDCEIVPVPGHLVVNTESMIVTKGSPFERLFNNYVNILRSTGALEVMRKRSWPSAPLNSDESSPKVKLQQVLSIFAILALGVAISVILLCREILFIKAL